jgi:hypothetical protein
MNSKIIRNHGAIASLVLLPVAVASCSSDSGTSAGKSHDTSPVGTTSQTSTYEMSMDGIEVPPGGELYKCQDFVNPFGKDIAITDSKSVMSPGSHHFAAFRMENLTTAGIMDCPAGGLEAHEFVHASQTPVQETSYPKDVGRFLPATDGLRLQVHYLNTTSEPLNVKATFSMHYVDADKIKYKAGGVFLNNLGLTVPPGKSTQTKSWALESDINLLVAVSHMHRHALDFTSSTDDGRMIFESQDWDGPTPAVFNPAMELATGTTITWACSFQNDTGDNLTFGESASKNEMCIFNGIYYPSPDGSSITQNLP